MKSVLDLFNSLDLQSLEKCIIIMNILHLTNQCHCSVGSRSIFLGSLAGALILSLIGKDLKFSFLVSFVSSLSIGLSLIQHVFKVIPQFPEGCGLLWI